MIEKILDLMRAEVADANMTGFADFHKTGHSVPRVAVVDILATEVAIGDRPVHMLALCQHRNRSVSQCGHQ